MAERSARRLARVHRVRTIQLGQRRAIEADAQARFASENALTLRIAQLAAGVAPQPVAADGIAFAAAALYRERLAQSAAAAQQRVALADARVAEASAATRAARRDQHAVEKLLERDAAAAALAAIRALEAAPPVRRFRHDPC